MSDHANDTSFLDCVGRKVGVQLVFFGYHDSANIHIVSKVDYLAWDLAPFYLLKRQCESVVSL